MAHAQTVVNEEKRSAVSGIVKLIEEYPIIGVVDMQSLPGKNLSAMRKKMREQVVIAMAKKRLLKIAFAQSKKAQELAPLEKHLEGMPALLFTRENPFTLFKTLKKNQSKAPIKGGQIAPTDLIVPAGPTSFPPGPIIGELGQLGIKGGVENGKVVIKKDAVLAEEGSVVSDKAAAFLTRMGIEPMRIGLRVTAVYENGQVLTSKVLDIDEEKFMRDLQDAALAGRGLSIATGFPTKDTIEALVQKAHYNAAGLALEANLVADDARIALAQEYLRAMGVAKYLPEDMRPEEAAPAEAAGGDKHQGAGKKGNEPEEPQPDAAAGLGSLFG